MFEGRLCIVIALHKQGSRRVMGCVQTSSRRVVCNRLVSVLVRDHVFGLALRAKSRHEASGNSDEISPVPSRLKSVTVKTESRHTIRIDLVE